MEVPNNREDRAPAEHLLLLNKDFSFRNWLHLIELVIRWAPMETHKQPRLLARLLVAL